MFSIGGGGQAKAGQASRRIMKRATRRLKKWRLEKLCSSSSLSYLVCVLMLLLIEIIPLQRWFKITHMLVKYLILISWMASYAASLLLSSSVDWISYAFHGVPFRIMDITHNNFPIIYFQKRQKSEWIWSHHGQLKIFQCWIIFAPCFILGCCLCLIVGLLYKIVHLTSSFVI